MRSYINEAPESVQPSKYSNVNFKQIGHGNPASDKINPSLLMDVNLAAKNANVMASVTTAVSGHRKGTRHEHGLAVDLAMFDNKGYGSKESAQKKGIYDKIEKFVRTLESMGYKVNSERGNDKAVLWFGFPNHHHHVHVSRKSDNGTSTGSGTQSTNFKNLPEKIKSSINKLKTKYGINITQSHIDKEFKQEGNIQPDNGGINNEAKKSIEKLIKDCKKANSKVRFPDGIVSDYRSYDDQVDNFGKKAKDRGVDDTQKYNTVPGFSQHHTGKAFDIFSTEPSWWDTNSGVKNWVADNCKKYGFKVTYNVDGVLRKKEPWHLFYIGNESISTTSNSTNDSTSNSTNDSTSNSTSNSTSISTNDSNDSSENNDVIQKFLSPLLGSLGFKEGEEPTNKLIEDIKRIKNLL